MRRNFSVIKSGLIYPELNELNYLIGESNLLINFK